MLSHVVTGGQSGVDQAAWRVAKKWGYKTSGMMPMGFMTEDGPGPEFALIGARESRSAERRVSDQSNVQACEVVLWLGPLEQPRYDDLYRSCSHSRGSVDRPIEHSLSRRIVTVENMGSRLENITGMFPVRDLLMSLTTVCIAGHRESSCQGIGLLTEQFLGAVFQMIRDKYDWDRKGYGRNLALRGKIFGEEPAEEPLEEDLDSMEQLEAEYKEAASRRVSPPGGPASGWLPGEQY